MKAVEFLQMFHYMVFTNDLYQRCMGKIKRNLIDTKEKFMKQNLIFESINEWEFKYSFKINNNHSKRHYNKLSFKIEQTFLKNNNYTNSKQIIRDVTVHTIKLMLRYIDNFINYSERNLQSLFLKDKSGANHNLFIKHLKNTKSRPEKEEYEQILEDLIFLEKDNIKRIHINQPQPIPILEPKFKLLNSEKNGDMRFPSKKSSENTNHSLRFSNIKK